MRTLALLALAVLASGCPSPAKRLVVVDESQVPSLNQTRWHVTHEPTSNPGDALMGRRVLSLVLAVAVAACGWRVRGPKRLDVPPGGRRVADRVILIANEGGIIWGGGRLGEVVRDTLLADGTFGEVYYPVEPRNPPALRLEVTARGTVEEDIAMGVAKSVLIGFLFLAPAGVIQFHKTFHLDAVGIFTDAEHEAAKIPVQTSTDVYFTVFSHVDGYDRAAQDGAFRDLGERLAAGLRAQVPPRP